MESWPSVVVPVLASINTSPPTDEDEPLVILIAPAVPDVEFPATRLTSPPFAVVEPPEVIVTLPPSFPVEDAQVIDIF